MGANPDRVRVGVEADGCGAVHCTQDSSAGWSGDGRELPQVTRGENLPHPSLNRTTNFEDGDHDWDKVSPEL